MAHIWHLNQWQKFIDVDEKSYKSGLRMHYEKGVDSEIYMHIDKFAQWLRQEFQFPLRVNVYVKEAKQIKAKDGDMVVGTIWRPASYSEYPHIRLATGDYKELVDELGKERAILAILHTFAHELTHYYQHINNLPLTQRGEERQATSYAGDIVFKYVEYAKNEGCKNIF